MITYTTPVAVFPPRNRTDLSHQHVFVGAARYYFNLVAAAAAGLFMHTDVACRLLYSTCVFFFLGEMQFRKCIQCARQLRFVT
jgi:hypothetical protein